MFQVRFHGRGGQGVVTPAELLAEAAFRESRHAQAFPSFGSERMGAPVMSFCMDGFLLTHASERARRNSATRGNCRLR
jgi:pyruvate ferredoxin oxidoreductase gamma subunit